MAEEAKNNHDERRQKDEAEDKRSQTHIERGDDQILCCYQNRTGPTVQRAPQLQGRLVHHTACYRVRRRNHHIWAEHVCWSTGGDGAGVMEARVRGIKLPSVRGGLQGHGFLQGTITGKTHLAVHQSFRCESVVSGRQKNI